MSRYDQKIKKGARPFLEDGEEVLEAFVARPRGWTQSMAGSEKLGESWQGKAQAGALQADFPLASPMALALTQRRLLSFEIGSPIGLGIGGKVKKLVGAVPLDDVDSIEVKRLALGKVVTLTVRGAEIKLEANAAADAKGLAEAFERSKASAVA